MGEPNLVLLVAPIQAFNDVIRLQLVGIVNHVRRVQFVKVPKLVVHFRDGDEFEVASLDLFVFRVSRFDLEYAVEITLVDESYVLVIDPLEP